MSKRNRSKHSKSSKGNSNLSRRQSRKQAAIAHNTALANKDN
jgi:hypothetical protein